MHAQSEYSPDSRRPLASQAAALKAMAMLKELGCRSAELGEDARETVA
jgi:hypothetical protein